MSFLQRILCRLGFHSRSRRKAKKFEGGWRSVCRGCGRAMVKLKGGDWRVTMQIQPTREEKKKIREVAARRRRVPPPPRRRPPQG